MLETHVYIRVNTLMYFSSVDLELQDRMAINLENLGEVFYYGVDGHHYFTNEHDCTGDEDDHDTSWLNFPFGIGTSSSQPLFTPPR
ncbi:hypothetical protein GIB67_039890 [Kingdonia uniflora]|uniref:Uncharacterized protein n=1 Tax=Kingdonia uniflora TaxID=39325 RepID=A0A7J7P3A9_9MAGN|nr:hypothetical protein GIB67_039890 [Kingdonia uniflora]